MYNFDIRNWLEPFLGTYKTVQVQLRHIRTRRLIRDFTTFFQKNNIRFKKNPKIYFLSCTNLTSEMGGLIDEDGKVNWC